MIRSANSALSAAFWLIFLSHLYPDSVHAHGIEISVSESGKAAVVQVLYSDGTPFSYEPYEVLPPPSEDGSSVPYQTGRTDVSGRVVFLPDRSGEWKVKIHSEDGHGGETSVTVDESGISEHSLQSNGIAGSFVSRAAMAIAIIAGTAGALSLLYSFKKNKG